MISPQSGAVWCFGFSGFYEGFSGFYELSPQPILGRASCRLGQLLPLWASFCPSAQLFIKSVAADGAWTAH
jgi:hypothetical protein